MGGKNESQRLTCDQSCGACVVVGLRGSCAGGRRDLSHGRQVLGVQGLEGGNDLCLGTIGHLVPPQDLTGQTNGRWTGATTTKHGGQ